MHLVRLKFYLAAIVALLISPSCCCAQKLHAIVLHDSNRDIVHSAGLSCSAIDGVVVGSSPVKQFELESGAVNRKELLARIDGVNAGAGDSIFFYYCGHGYINQKRTPYILPGGDRAPLYLKDILARLKRKRAHRTVVFFDMCQSLRPTTEQRPAPMEGETSFSPLFQSIFFGEPNRVPFCVISSAPGEVAIAAHIDDGTLLHGSVFSTAFAKVSREHGTEALGWAKLVKTLKVSVAKEFATVKKSGLGTLGTSRFASLAQTTQTVTVYRPIEVR